MASSTPVIAPNPSPHEPSNWSRSQRAGVLILAVAIAALLPAAYRMASPFLSATVLAAILAVALDPLQRRVCRLITRSSVAALITTLVAIGPALILIWLVGVVMNREIKSGVLEDMLRAGERLTSGSMPAVSIDRHGIQQALAQLSQVAGGLLFTGGLAVLFLYVLLVHGKAWVAQLTALLPLESSVTNRILSTVRDSIVANVDGILAVAAAEAVVFGIIFWVAGIGSPAMWGALAGLSSMLPVVGGTIVWLPLSVIAGIHGTYVKALLVGLGCLVGQTAVSELLRPRVVGSRLQQPPLLIALSVLGGTIAFGALGILLGPVIVSVLAALVRELRSQLRPSSPCPTA